jgi:hypothetical protein
MKRIKQLMVAVLGTLAATWDRLTKPAGFALPNELALMNEHGVETLIINAGTAPVSSRYLLYKRGSGGANFCDICTASDLPMGISSDSPYQDADLVNVRRLGLRKGFEIGMAATAITIDHLVTPAAAGKVQDLSLISAGANYYVIGRCNKTVAALAEVSFVPCTPYLVTVASLGSWSLANPA